MSAHKNSGWSCLKHALHVQHILRPEKQIIPYPAAHECDSLYALRMSECREPTADLTSKLSLTQNQYEIIRGEDLTNLLRGVHLEGCVFPHAIPIVGGDMPLERRHNKIKSAYQSTYTSVNNN
jgi:hypothetical protein